MLQPVLPLDPEGTLLSYADRMSLFHTGRGMERVLKDIGIARDPFMAGHPDAASAFAEATGHPADMIHRLAIRVSPRIGTFRGEDITRSFLSPRAARYCPLCLAEDGPVEDRRFRLIWGFSLVHRCDRHGVHLASSRESQAINLRLSMAGDALATPVRTRTETPQYLDWLRRRLEGYTANDSAWLAGQTLEQVLMASHMLGAVMAHGHKVVPRNLLAQAAEAVTETGFSIYREGKGAIDEALDAVRRASPAKAVQAGPLAYYGQLYDWLDRRSNAIDPGPIRDILREHIVKNSAVEPATTVLGVEITERRFHTLQSLAKEIGTTRKRMERLLKKLGEIPADATEVESGNMVFAADHVVPLIESFHSAVSLSDVPSYLGASKGQVEALYRCGIVEPLVPRTGRGSVRNVVVARDHLDTLLATLGTFAIADPASHAMLRPMAHACQHGAGPFEEVFKKVLSGEMPATRRAGAPGIGAILINTDHIAAKNTET